jgi:hypothetical protein
LFLCCTFRIQYIRWKEECRQIFPVVGSGRFITAPVITEDGQPIQEPLVILETNQDRGPSAETGNADGNGTNQSRRNASCSEMVRDLTSHGPLDQKVIQWLLTLHQIGWLCSYINAQISLFIGAKLVLVLLSMLC